MGESLWLCTRESVHTIGSQVGLANHSVGSWVMLPALPASGRLHDLSTLPLHHMPYQHCQWMHAALPALHIPK